MPPTCPLVFLSTGPTLFAFSVAMTVPSIVFSNACPPLSFAFLAIRVMGLLQARQKFSSSISVGRPQFSQMGIRLYLQFFFGKLDFETKRLTTATGKWRKIIYVFDKHRRSFQVACPCLFRCQLAGHFDSKGLLVGICYSSLPNSIGELPKP